MSKSKKPVDRWDGINLDENDEDGGYVGGENAAYLRSQWELCVKSRKHLKRITVVMRSAERVDRVFGSQWTTTEKFMDKVYATDLNVPKDVTLHPNCYRFNPPITYMGRYTSQLISRALHNRGIKAQTIYCSPTLRTVQTAAAIARSTGTKICVEPGLLEPVEWYKLAGAKQLPEFCGEAIEKYNIDKTYKPIFSMREMNEMFDKKNQSQCIQRTVFVVRNICGEQRDHPAIIIGHAITMEVANRIGEHGNAINSDAIDECTSYEDSIFTIDPSGSGAKLELGVRYPPGSVMALARTNDSPPYVLQTVPDVIPPLTMGVFSNRI